MAGPPWLDPHDGDTPRSRPVELRAYPWQQRPTVLGPNLIPTMFAIEAGPTASETNATKSCSGCKFCVLIGAPRAATPPCPPGIPPGSGSKGQPRRCYRTKCLTSSLEPRCTGLSLMTRVRRAAGRLRLGAILLRVRFASGPAVAESVRPGRHESARSAGLVSRSGRATDALHQHRRHRGRRHRCHLAGGRSGRTGGLPCFVSVAPAESGPLAETLTPPSNRDRTSADRTGVRSRGPR